MTNDVSMTRKQSTVLVFSLISLFILLMVPVQGQTDHKAMEYEVSVRALILPIFAVDGDGNPVFDLKKEEIQFFVNGKPFDIAEFTAFTAEGLAEEAKKTAPPVPDQKPIQERKPVQALKAPARINFIILDALSNTEDGVKRARKIAVGLVEKSPEQDAFVILHAHPHLGLKYITGPETDKKKLVEAIHFVPQRAGRPYGLRVPLRKRRTRSTYDIGGLTPANLADIDFIQKRFDSQMAETRAAAQKYRKKVKFFAYSLGQLKYVLKTVVQPKTVFLVSGGVPEGALGNNLIQYYEFLGDAAKAINHGGGLLYLVNPMKPYKTGMGNSMRFMADQSGGRYFAGSVPEQVIEKVKNNTSAYYELAFYPGDQPKDKMKVEIKCKRKNVKLNTVSNAERGKKYIEMPEIQRKLFALSVVLDGSWSRILGEVSKTEIKTVNVAKSDRKNIEAVKDVEIALPPAVANRSVDAFIIHLEPVTMKAIISLKRLEIRDKLNLKIPVIKEKQQFVVLVDPDKTKCVYNRVL